MTNKTWYLALGIAGVSFSFVGVQACTVTNSPLITDGGVFDFDSGEDSATNADSSTTPDSGTTADTGSGGCGVSPQTGSATCDTCLETACCTQLETCFGTQADVTPSCEMLVSCVQDIESTNGGNLADALDTCAPADAGSTYSATDITNAKAMLACLGDGDAGSNVCGTACTH
jgi:hypothetical protein